MNFSKTTQKKTKRQKTHQAKRASILGAAAAWQSNLPEVTGSARFRAITPASLDVRRPVIGENKRTTQTKKGYFATAHQRVSQSTGAPPTLVEYLHWLDSYFFTLRILKPPGQSAGCGSFSPVTGLWCCSLCTPCRAACLVGRAQLAHLLPLLHRLLLVVYCQKQAIWVRPLSALHSALSQINPPDSLTTLLITYGARDAVVAEKNVAGTR